MLFTLSLWRRRSRNRIESRTIPRPYLNDEQWLMKRTAKSYRLAVQCAQAARPDKIVGNPRSIRSSLPTTDGIPTAVSPSKTYRATEAQIHHPSLGEVGCCICCSVLARHFLSWVFAPV